MIQQTSPFSLSDAVAYFAEGEKSPSQLAIGQEQEVLVLRKKDNRPLEFSGEITELLDLFEARGGYRPLMDTGQRIGLKNKHFSLTLEPGCQVEMSEAPQTNLFANYENLIRFFGSLSAFAEKLEAYVLTVGYNPFFAAAETPRLPKQRYHLMRSYMPQTGLLGLEMMHATCTLQANFDYVSEKDMVKKMRVLTALQPLITILFAGSPFVKGRLEPVRSYRARIWLDTDSKRSGIWPMIFEDSFGYEAYARHLIQNVPMYFVERNHNYYDALGASFEAFSRNAVDGLKGFRPLMKDFMHHAGTAFPQVRLRQYLEVRGADSVPWSFSIVLSAFLAGLIYDTQTLDDLEALVMTWGADSVEALNTQAPWANLETVFEGKTLCQWLWDLGEQSRRNLRKRPYRSGRGHSEDLFLEPFFSLLSYGEGFAERLRRLEPAALRNDPLFAPKPSHFKTLRRALESGEEEVLFEPLFSFNRLLQNRP